MRPYRDQPVDPPYCSPTRRQQAFLHRYRLDPDRTLDFHAAGHVIGEFARERRQLPPTVKQERFLKQFPTYSGTA